MKAVLFDHHGSAEGLQYRDVPIPRPSTGEVLVKIDACGVNHLDIWTREGLGVPIPMPHILGCEPVGKIAEVGVGVTNVRTGDFVLCAPGSSCGNCPACLSGNDSLCPDYQVMGFQRQGGYAEYCVCKGTDAIPVSSRFQAEEWAAIPLVFLTAWHMLITRAGLRAGETVLVHGAGSGIGSAAIQIAKLIGCMVITTAGSAAKLEKAKALGADYGINYTANKEFHREVKKATSGRGVDVVFEHIGQATWTESLASMAPGGRLVFCGTTTGPTVTMDLRFVFVRQFSLLGSYMGAKQELLKVLALVEQGKLKPVVDTVFPLAQARAAHERMASRNFFGKLVLRCC
ncbi:MAG: zinc-binding dehydrogenase [Deltaproteobacteria bacterium]|nr:zinc-binding dehydrogenase [Deltaproteobacteria bacterium]